MSAVPVLHAAPIHKINSGATYAAGLARRPALGTVYAIELGKGGPIKIGFTFRNDARQRMREVARRRGCTDVYILCQFAGTVDDEARLHFYFRAHRIAPETYAPVSHLTALLALSPQDVCQFLRRNVPNPPTMAKLSNSVKNNTWHNKPSNVVNKMRRVSILSRKDSETISSFSELFADCAVNNPDDKAIRSIETFYGVRRPIAHLAWALDRLRGHVVPSAALCPLISASGNKKIVDVYACWARRAGIAIKGIKHRGFYLDGPLSGAVDTS